MKREHSIDVILTAYKRPELLWEQLEAVKNQSVKPANIFLYQDGTGLFYEIRLIRVFPTHIDHTRRLGISLEILD